MFLLDEKNKNTLLQMLTQKLETPEYKEKLFEETLPLKALPQTFFVTSQGIKFVWHIYEIAPYVYGEIELHIPYKDLKSFVNPSSPYAYLFGL
ncbi:RsiV family protein [Helicobacter typhlonius]|uniref:RsiV family protein n=1 Tax=Helicobacter typhlonius TaxID=76936 RepID=UPI002FDF11FC